MDLSRRLRERQRQGALGDTLAHLQARLRSGQLQPAERAAAVLSRLVCGELGWERVELAGYLGDPLGRELVGVEPLVELASYLEAGSGAVNVIVGDAPDRDDLASWLRGVTHWGRRVLSWSLLGASRVLVVAATTAPGVEDDDPYADYDWAAVAESASRSLDALEAWLRADLGGRPKAETLGWGTLARAVRVTLEVAGGAPVEPSLMRWLDCLPEFLDHPQGIELLLEGVQQTAGAWALGALTGDRSSGG